MQIHTGLLLTIVASLAIGLSLFGCSAKEDTKLPSKNNETSIDKKKSPVPDKESRDKALKLAEEALEEEKKGNISAAIKLYDKSIELDYNQVTSRFRRGVIYLKAFEFKKTIEDLEVVQKQNPKWVASSNLILGEAYKEIGDIDKSNKVLKSTYPKIKKDAFKVKALRTLSDNYRKQKNYKEALTYINDAIALNPRSGVIRADRVTLYLELNQKDKAFEELDYIIKKTHAGNKDYHRHAILLMEKKRYAEAIEDLNKVIDANTYNREYLKLRLDAARKAGNIELAKKDEKRLKNFDDISGPPRTMGKSFNQQ